MLDISSAQRRELRARAHALKPVVLIGDSGLTPSVIAEIERNLLAHELIKIRASGADREERDAMLAAICEQTGCAEVQHIGKILVIYRPAPPKPKKQPARTSGYGASAGERRPGRSAPRAKPVFRAPTERPDGRRGDGPRNVVRRRPGKPRPSTRD